MAGRPYLLAETNWKTVRDTRYDVAILPWGATEAHNFHLPYGTDVIESEAVAAESARRAWERGTRALVLPCVPFGVNTGQLDVPFCMNMNPSTQAAVLADVAAVLDAHAVSKLVILNGHGGNDFRQMIRELQPKAETVAVKRLAGKGSSLSLSHAEAKMLIRAAAQRAVKNLSSYPSWTIEGTVEMTFRYYAKDKSPAVYKGGNVLEAFEAWLGKP